MNTYLIIKNVDKRWLLFYAGLYFSLIISLILGENSTGGAIIDYTENKKISEHFSENFYKTFLSYDQYSTRHSPVFLIFLSFFKKFNLNDIFIRFIHMNLCLILPIYLFKSLNLVLKNKQIVLFLVSLVFISPTFRSLSVWPDSRVLGLAFFTISIYYYLKFSVENKFIYCFKNIFFLSLSAYLSPNFAVFAIFYFYKYFLFYKNNFNYLIYIIIINLILSTPAFIYLDTLETNFLLKTGATNLEPNTSYLFTNIFNKIMIISSIVFFYLFPFLLLKIIKYSKYRHSDLIVSLVLTLVCIYYFDYLFKYTGGGIFFKISYYFFNNNILFYFISFTSFLIIINLFRHKFENIILILLLIISNPQLTIYHKYYDPLLLILFFTLFHMKIDSQIMKDLKVKIVVFLYFFIFLIVNNLKSYVF